MDIKISIIMPVYNAQDYLESAIESVRSQSLKEFELILVDDGSKDGSGEICDRFAQLDERIRVIHKENGGICDARNAGMAAAVGAFIGFMDNDDILDPDTLKDNFALLQKHGADWVKFGKRELLLLDGKRLAEKKTNFKEAVYTGRQIVDDLLKLRAEDTMTFVWDSFIKRELITDNGLQFDTNFKSGNEDIDLCEQLAPLCRKLVVNPACYYNHYTRLGVSASSKYSDDKIQSYLYLLRKSNERYARYGIDKPETDRDYVYIVTKQVIVNVCQKLNDAGKLLTAEQKRTLLNQFRESPELARYVQADIRFLFSRSKKLFVYALLFHLQWYRMLLFADKLSRKLAYWIRSIGAK